MSASLGTQFKWVEVRSKKDKRSFADVVRSSFPPLSGANRVPVGAPRCTNNRPYVFGRSNSEDLFCNLYYSGRSS